MLHMSNWVCIPTKCIHNARDILISITCALCVGVPFCASGCVRVRD